MRKKRLPERARKMRAAFAPVEAGLAERPAARAEGREVEPYPGQFTAALLGHRKLLAVAGDDASPDKPVEHAPDLIHVQVIVAAHGLAQRALLLPLPVEQVVAAGRHPYDRRIQPSGSSRGKGCRSLARTGHCGPARSSPASRRLW